MEEDSVREWSPFENDSIFEQRLKWQQVNSPSTVVINSSNPALSVSNEYPILTHPALDQENALTFLFKSDRGRKVGSSGESSPHRKKANLRTDDDINNNKNSLLLEDATKIFDQYIVPSCVTPNKSGKVTRKLKLGTKFRSNLKSDLANSQVIEKENYVSMNGTSTPVKDAELRSKDRFIPMRHHEEWQAKYSVNVANICNLSENNGNKKRDHTNNEVSQRDSITYQCLLHNELLGYNIDNVSHSHPDPNKIDFNARSSCKNNLFSYRRKVECIENIDADLPYSLSPLGPKSQRLLRSPRKSTRRIARIPYKVLDAPELQDDFYLNLVDWSSMNILAVGLSNSVYLWSACTSQVTRLCDFITDGNTVTSVGWNVGGNQLAVGTHQGYIQIWDVSTSKLISTLYGHTARVGALAWNGESLASGSRDRVIIQRDVRSPASTSDRRLNGHRQEVCGLKWSTDNQYLASGGNDNRLYVWSEHSNLPVQTYTDHCAAVKAIAWSPHQHGLLASGGGTADRCLRFWNTLTGQSMQCIDTGSQVCNLAWSKHSYELVSTHGYSQNQIIIWKYPSLTQVAKLTGHSFRVLYLAVSPDGDSVVTGAGDETLRFWNVFAKLRAQKNLQGKLNLYQHIR